MINELGGNLFIMEFIQKESMNIRDSYLPSILYTKESIMESENLTPKEKIQALNLMDEMNKIVMKIFDTPQINLIIANIINETIERMDKIKGELSNGKLLLLLLDNNREEPNSLTRNYELNEITRSVYTNSFNAFNENIGNSPQLKAAIENIFSYNLINKMCIDTIDLFDDFLFKTLKK
jgi:hypothetical protein